jgi:hypothetical protein
MKVKVALALFISESSALKLRDRFSLSSVRGFKCRSHDWVMMGMELLFIGVKVNRSMVAHDFLTAKGCRSLPSVMCTWLRPAFIRTLHASAQMRPPLLGV